MTPQLFPALGECIALPFLCVCLVKTSLGDVIRSGLAGSWGLCIFIVVDTEKPLPDGSPSAPHSGSSTFWATPGIACCWTVAILVGGRELPCGFNLHFPIDQGSWGPFHMLLAILISLLGAVEMSCIFTVVVRSGLLWMCLESKAEGICSRSGHVEGERGGRDGFRFYFFAWATGRRGVRILEIEKVQVTDIIFKNFQHFEISESER